MSPCEAKTRKFYQIYNYWGSCTHPLTYQSHIWHWVYTHKPNFKFWNFREMAQEIPWSVYGWSVIFRNCVKFSVWGPHLNSCTDGGEIWRGFVHAKFHQFGATCRPCAAKNLKITPCVTEIPAYALHAAAGNWIPPAASKLGMVIEEVRAILALRSVS